MTFKINPVFLTDAYKLSHKKFETEGTEYVLANFTPRSFHLCPLDINKAVVFGAQRMVQKLKETWDENFFSRDVEEVMSEAVRLFKPYLGLEEEGLQHFRDLHTLGCLPLSIKAIPEGVRVKAKTPVLFVSNTLPGYSWLVTYLETWISTELWLPMTSATTVYEFRKLVNEYALQTTGATDGTEFQLHDFSYRGMGPDEAGSSGAGFLLSSWGTDTIPAICELEHYYDANIEQEPIAFSVPATEHSVTCVGIGVNGEKETMRKWITETYPTGIVSIVADTLDYWKVITEYAEELKGDILNRMPNAIGLVKTVFRPDSGDPVKILTGYLSDEFDFDGEHYWCKNTGNMLSEEEVKGSVQCLWDIFGGTVTEQDYKVLNERVGLIYGDSITYERAQQIMERLKAKGFASTNVVFGVGSYTMRYVTRDTLGSAVKVTWAQVGGEEYAVAKSPKTDTEGVKKSAKGYIDVIMNNGEYVLKEFDSREEYFKGTEGVSQFIFIDGVLCNRTSLTDVRERLWK